jgi:hypothetical protein
MLDQLHMTFTCRLRNSQGSSGQLQEITGISQLNYHKVLREKILNKSKVVHSSLALIFEKPKMISSLHLIGFLCLILVGCPELTGSRPGCCGNLKAAMAAMKFFSNSIMNLQILE